MKASQKGPVHRVIRSEPPTYASIQEDSGESDASVGDIEEPAHFTVSRHDSEPTSTKQNREDALSRTKSAVSLPVSTASNISDMSLYDRTLHMLANDVMYQKEVALGKRIGFYRLGKELGSGNFSKVKLGVHVLTKEKVAVKIMEKGKMDQKAQRLLAREIQSMEQMNHPNIIRLFECVDTLTRVHLILEYAGGGELYVFVHERGKLSETEAKPLYAQIVSAVSHMHSRNLVHRDIKAENVMFAAPGVVKLVDFGFSCLLPSALEPLSTFCGSPPYAAPELFRDKSYAGTAVDVWALAVLLYFMLVGVTPFRGETVQDLKSTIMAGIYTIPDYISQSAQNLIRSMLNMEASNRPGIDEIKKNFWLQDCRFEKSYMEITLVNEKNDAEKKKMMDKVWRIMNSYGIDENMFEEDIGPRNAITGTFRIIQYQLQSEEKNKQKTTSTTAAVEEFNPPQANRKFTKNTFLKLILVFAFISIVRSKNLNCDFHSKCCWAGDSGWQIQNGETININEFRRTFLVGRSKPPPEGNYIRRVSTRDQGVFSSCPFCSSVGVISVDYRNWQSPTSRLSLCWSQANETTNLNDCHPAFASKQSQTISQDFKVPNGTDIMLHFISENTDERIESVIMIDRIRVNYDQCHKRSSSVHHKQKLIPVEPAKPILVENQRTNSKAGKKVSLEQLAQLDDRVKEKLLSRPKGVPSTKQTIPSLPPLSPPPVKSSLSQELSKKPEVATKQPKDFNPLNDLLGEDLANFLDPNYVTDDANEDEEQVDDAGEQDFVDEEKPTPVLPIKQETVNVGNSHLPPVKQAVTTQPSPIAKSTLIIPRKPLVVKPAPILAEFHRPLPMGIPQSCETRGGCLFENGFCSWTAPVEVPQASRFHLKSVGLSKFIQATVPSGEVSVLETDTLFSDTHTVIFDVLEWKLGTRLIGCCFVNDSLECPYTTPSEAGAVLWHVGKFECPVRTQKIVFICENYGTSEGICGLDNIRLHHSSDLFFIEPCQKNILPQL
ncbi:unnamed protein product [Auanema sp. JU1783]|nr:unnamed protein product [Auanema sp. JU1783]